jgi:hypothetical protein
MLVPSDLVILWWNWPPEHWMELQDGASMIFLEEPPPGLVANSAMTPEQLDTAALFVDKLIELGVLERPVEPLANSFPLFLVPKALTGQWRCMADGKSGGQNLVCTSDAVHLGTPDDILPYLYKGEQRLCWTSRSSSTCSQLSQAIASIWAWSTRRPARSGAMPLALWAIGTPPGLWVVLATHFSNWSPKDAPSFMAHPDAMTSSVT